MSVSSDLRHDGDRCPGCHRLLSGAEWWRVVHEEGSDVVVVCGGCGLPTIIPWVREAA